MDNRIEAIDYLRGLSIIAILIIHIIARHDKLIWTQYTNVPLLFMLRDVLQFSVVAIIICSSFSLYASYKNLKIDKKSLVTFYKKRIKRLLVPWWSFLAIFFSIHYLIKGIFGLELVNLSPEYIIKSFLMIGGIGYGWIILLLLILSFLFPFLNYDYKKINRKTFFLLYTILYLISAIFFYSACSNIFELNINLSNTLIILLGGMAFFLGWSIMYLIGFLLEDFYTNHRTNEKERVLILYIFFSYIFLLILYSSLKINTHFYLNKYPPSPHYLSFGLLITIILLTLLFNYKTHISKSMKKFLSFLSFHSYWFFIESALTISFISYFLSMIDFSSIYLKFFIDIILNFFAIVSLIIVQSKLSLKLKIKLRKHHF